MDLVVILLAFIIIVLIYVLYFYFTSTVTTLSGLTYLGMKADGSLKSISPILPVSIINNTSPNYAYGIWLFITRPMDKIQANNYQGGRIFSRFSELLLRYDGTSLILTLPKGQNLGNKNLIDTTIYNNIPIQKWIQVIINVGTTNVDVYINGKLNTTIYNPKTFQPIATDQIYFNSHAMPMYISNFQRWGNAIDTATAYSSYMNGNGTSSSLIPSINASAAMLKDGVIQSQYSLF
jgi:hypothetical protein